MKDYSNFTKNQYGFITGYEIKDEEVLVYTPKTGKNKPQKYSANEANYYDERIKEQYQMIIEHQEEIIKSKRKKTMKIFAPICTIIATIILLTYVVFLNSLIIGLGTLGLLLVGLSATVVTTIKEEKFKQSLRYYNQYIKAREQIEQSDDENITEYLNTDTLSLINENEKLKQEGIIDATYNMNLMDRMSLEELKTLLIRYKISKGLQEPQAFNDKALEESIDTPLKKTRKK